MEQESHVAISGSLPVASPVEPSKIQMDRSSRLRLLLPGLSGTIDSEKGGQTNQLSTSTKQSEPFFSILSFCHQWGVP